MSVLSLVPVGTPSKLILFRLCGNDDQTYAGNSREESEGRVQI
jgi:hypothetical protein